jgi:hypothetical protein
LLPTWPWSRPPPYLRTPTADSSTMPPDVSTMPSHTMCCPRLALSAVASSPSLLPTRPLSRSTSLAARQP